MGHRTLVLNHVLPCTCCVCSTRLAIKHGKEREADAFAHACRAAHALERWAQGIQAQRQRRAAKARAVHPQNACLKGGGEERMMVSL